MYDFDFDPKQIKDKLMIRMSENFLSNTFPSEAIDWDVHEYHKWIEENICEDFEYWSAPDVLELIERSAMTAYMFMTKELST